VLVLLHGFPSASHQFRELIPLLADRFHIVAPDLPGFGKTDMPPRDDFGYTFDHLAGVIDLDNYYLARPGNDEVQLDLFLDYASNVALYPAWQQYFRESRPPLLAVWGKNDPFFLPAGAEAFKRDIPDADVRFFDTGHFALETHVAEIAAAIGEFLAR
jgi:pimeloyl-ACP methyl ester carboxylesterase